MLSPQRKTNESKAGVLGKDIPLSAIEAEIEEAAQTWVKPEKKTQNSEKDPRDFIVSPSALIDIREYRPEVDKNGTWWVSEVDCEFLAMGCSILACGGGGPGYLCYMAARAAIKAGARLPVVDIDSLPEDGYVMGALAYGYVHFWNCRLGPRES